MSSKLPVAILFALTCVWLYSCGPNETVAIQEIRAFGFAPVLPPSTLAPPGTIIHFPKDAVANQQIAFGLVCKADKTLRNGTSPQQSKSATFAINKQLEKHFTFDVDALKKLTASADFDSVKNVTLDVKNVQIFEVADTDIQKVDEQCATAVRQRLDAGEQVALVSGVILADVVYTVVLSDNSTAKLQATMPRIAASLGGEWRDKTSSTVEGQSLYWGMASDAVLLKTAMGGLYGASADSKFGTINVEAILTSAKQ
jgi:hypothetical protein